jgi:hypothetical protein
MTLLRWRVLLAAAWAGMLLTVAAIATPAPFAVLPQADAGRVVARVLASEAYASLVLALAVFMLERRRSRDGAATITPELLLALGALFCTVLGYFGLQPMMAAAKAGQGPWPFAVLHGVSLGFFAAKGLLVAALAWRVSAPTTAS